MKNQVSWITNAWKKYVLSEIIYHPVGMLHIITECHIILLHVLNTVCYGLNVCVLPKFTRWKPSPVRLYVETGSSWRQFKLNEVVRVGLWFNGISVLTKRDTRELAHALSTCTEERPYEDMTSWWLSVIQGERPQQTATDHAGPWYRASQPPELS